MAMEDEKEETGAIVLGACVLSVAYKLAGARNSLDQECRTACRPGLASIRNGS